jgi:hypothetical protein
VEYAELSDCYIHMTGSTTWSWFSWTSNRTMLSYAVWANAFLVKKLVAHLLHLAWRKCLIAFALLIGQPFSCGGNTYLKIKRVCVVLEQCSATFCTRCTPSFNNGSWGHTTKFCFTKRGYKTMHGHEKCRYVCTSLWNKLIYTWTHCCRDLLMKMGMVTQFIDYRIHVEGTNRD